VDDILGTFWKVDPQNEAAAAAAAAADGSRRGQGGPGGPGGPGGGSGDVQRPIPRTGSFHRGMKQDLVGVCFPGDPSETVTRRQRQRPRQLPPRQRPLQLAEPVAFRVSPASPPFSPLTSASPPASSACSSPLTAPTGRQGQEEPSRPRHSPAGRDPVKTGRGCGALLVVICTWAGPAWDPGRRPRGRRNGGRGKGRGGGDAGHRLEGFP